MKLGPIVFSSRQAFKVDAKQYNSKNVISSAFPPDRNMADKILISIKQHFLKRRVLVIAETAAADVVIV